MTPDQPLPEFTDTYTKAEALRRIVPIAVSAAVLLYFFKTWLFPTLHEFADTAHCRSVHGVAGVKVLWYGLFVGMPALWAVVVGAYFGGRGYKSLRDGQFPPLKEKSVRPVRIRRGRAAQLVATLHFAACLPLPALALWGVGAAAEMAARPVSPAAAQACAALIKQEN